MQTVTTEFSNLASGQVRPISVVFKVSFDKTYDDSVDFFTLDSSLLDGVDILASEDETPIQAWDFYRYLAYSDRIISADFSREISFPYSVTSAIADIVLNNYDNYFTPGSGSDVADYIIPGRPNRILAGFNGETIPQFVGITEDMPLIDNGSNTVSFHSIDFLSQIKSINTSNLLAMTDVRTDEVLAAMFDEFGLASSMYSLDEGANVVPFLFYPKGTSTGTIFNDLMEAEGGNLWLDEKGVIRFSNRYAVPGSSVITLDDTDIIDISIPDANDIVNRVVITSDVRELQPFQSVWSMSDNNGTNIDIPASSSVVANITLEDPCTTITNPTLGEETDTSWFTAINSDDETDVTSDISVTGQSLGANTLTLFFQNDNAYDVTVNAMELYGEPAIIVDTIEYDESLQSSIDKYGEKLLEIDNNFIQSLDQAQSLGVPILLYRSEYANTIQIEVKSRPQLQLNDMITIDYAPYSDDYRVTKIVSKINNNQFTQVLTCIKNTALSIFTLDSSLLDGEDVLGL